MNKNMRWPCPKLGGIPPIDGHWNCLVVSTLLGWSPSRPRDLDRSTRVMSLAHCSADLVTWAAGGREKIVVLALCWSLEFSSTQMDSTDIFVGALWNQCNWLCLWFGTAYCVVRILPSIRSIQLSIYLSIHPSIYLYIYIYMVGGLTHVFMIFHILGMSSSQLTNSIICQRGWVETTNQVY